jgi:hypothetical protein
MGQSNQRARDNTYENLQNLMLERQDAASTENFGMYNTPGDSAENPMNTVVGEGNNTGGMQGTSMKRTDFANQLNAALGDMGGPEQGKAPGMAPGMEEEEEEEVEGMDMGPGRANREARRRMR